MRKSSIQGSLYEENTFNWLYRTMNHAPVDKVKDGKIQCCWICSLITCYNSTVCQYANWQNSNKNRPGSYTVILILASFWGLCMESSEQKGAYNSWPICTKKGWFLAKGAFILFFLNMPSNPIFSHYFNFCDTTLLFSIRLGICSYIWPWLSWSTTVFCKLSVRRIK